jgi:hypothetical protein
VQIYVILTYQVPVSVLRVYPKHIDTSDTIHTKRYSNMEHFLLYNTEPLIGQTYEKYEKLNKVYIIYVSPYIYTRILYCLSTIS